MIAAEEAFEGATPLARRVKAAGPYRSPGELITRARALITALTSSVNAHPRIGEDPKRLSARSLAEQGAEALPELQRLNAEYERRFGFRFVIFVDRRPKSAIVDVLQQRLQRSRAEEMAAGLEAIVDIAQDRLRT
jgi:2-oxo-4-hydroxy-4-carboxy--5-ureidoimidazoline (OHCU) decarboxylase